MFHVPEKDRINNHPLRQMNSDVSFGNNGCFSVNLSLRSTAWIIASDGEGWEHVSVHIVDNQTKQKRTPTWAEMCKVKDIFWDADDCIVQYHPPQSEYVNNHKHTLHLWKQIGAEFPLPDSIMVGIK